MWGDIANCQRTHWSNTSPTLVASSCVNAHVVPFSAWSLSSSESVRFGRLLGELSLCDVLRGDEGDEDEASVMGVVYASFGKRTELRGVVGVGVERSMDISQSDISDSCWLCDIIGKGVN